MVYNKIDPHSSSYDITHVGEIKQKLGYGQRVGGQKDDFFFQASAIKEPR